MTPAQERDAAAAAAMLTCDYIFNLKALHACPEDCEPGSEIITIKQKLAEPRNGINQKIQKPFSDVFVFVLFCFS